MYRSALRTSSCTLRALRQTKVANTSRRYLSTSLPANKPRTWKGSAVRWGLAAAAVYWYNTSPIFADEPAPSTIPAPAQFSDSDLQTVDAVIAEKRKRAEQKTKAVEPATPTAPTVTDASQATLEPGSPEALEEEAGQQGAFNPETGEINWDCPCLGGMADGPCGEEFKSAFSCFVYSTEEPKGMDCIEKFQGMQECFRKYPEIYGAELAESEADEEGQPAFDSAPAAEGTPIPEKSSTPISEREQSAAGSESVSETPQDSELSPEVSEKPATSAKVEAPGPSAS